MTISGFIDCPICGDPVPQTGTRAKRLYHPECKRFKNHLDAAVRAGGQILLLDTETKRTIRALLFRAANQFRTPQLRSSDGRFVQRESEPDG